MAAFLYYFLLDASLPEVFIKALLKETCDPTLAKEISDCDWDSDTQTLTTPEEKKQDDALDDLEGASWYKNAFDLQELGIMTPKTTADKTPEALFDLDADALRYTTIHNRHLKPTYNVDDEDDESEALVPAAKASLATPPRNNPDKETP